MSEAARALIGCCLTRDQIFKKERVKAFAHDLPETMKFDPDTGKPLWANVSRCILMPRDADYVDGCDLSCVEPREELGGLYLFHDRSGWGSAETRYLLGVYGVEDDEYRRQNFVPIVGDKIEVARVKVHDILKPHGLWDPSKFGLWVVRYTAI